VSVKPTALVFTVALWALASMQPSLAKNIISPSVTIKTTTHLALSILQNISLNQQQQWSEIGQLIDRSFDFRSMSQSALSEDWKVANGEERKLFVDYLAQYLEDTYRQKFQRYKQQSSIITSEQIRKDRAIVETQILGDGRPILVTYRLKNNDGKWYVYDVLIRGESVVTESRELFDAIVKAEGLEGLKSDLENRVKIYKSKYGELP
jgi:phospholipid transport system substrate-binding protein|tara:strand:- start:3022 stop:3642 length:621 start_codon:yes stop_codon:yes gene_type:complete